MGNAVATREKKAQYDIEELQQQFPSLKTLAAPPSKACERAWVAAFTEKPEAMESMISDLIKQAYAVPGRIGQRPMPREEDVNLEALIYGELSDDPLHIALPKLIKTSERAFVMKIHMNRRTYQRMMIADINDPNKFWPDAELLARIAAAVKVPASYFLEYRLMAAQAAFIKLITDRPGIATKLYRDFIETYKQSPFVQSR